MENNTTVFATAKRIAKIADTVMFQIIRWISILCFVALFLLVIVMVSVRFIPLFSMHWFDEIQIWVFAGLIFFGSAGLWIIRDHFKLDALNKFIKNRTPLMGALLTLFIELASLFFISVFTYESYVLLAGDMGYTNDFRIPEQIVHLTSLFIPGTIMVIYSIKNTVLALIKTIRIVQGKTDPGQPPADGEKPTDQNV